MTLCTDLTKAVQGNRIHAQLGNPTDTSYAPVNDTFAVVLGKAQLSLPVLSREDLVIAVKMPGGQISIGATTIAGKGRGYEAGYCTCLLPVEHDRSDRLLEAVGLSRIEAIALAQPLPEAVFVSGR